MKLFKKSYDGGKESGVTGYWIVECKKLFSIVILRFSKGSREAFHSHAFDALTWWISGSVLEEFEDGRHPIKWHPSLKPKRTLKNTFHKIIAEKVSWAISIRGPWQNTWQEVKNGEKYTLTHGRVRL